MDMTVFHGAPDRDADLHYFGGFRAPDPFLAAGIDGKRVAVLSPLELDRGRRESRFDEIHSLEDVREELGERGDDLAARILWLAGRHGADRLFLPEDFPAKTAFDLRSNDGPAIEFLPRPVCAGRRRKSAVECEAIRRVNGVISGAFRTVEEILGESSVRDGRIVRGGEPLTAEAVRTEIGIHCLRRGCIAESTIVAGGDQACDPHERGTGPLPANELIIVDIFPRDEATGYFGDMTRTYCKGTAPEEARRIVEAVRRAQELALERIAAGVDGREVHRAVVDFFEGEGFSSGRGEDGFHGFFHGTGHGLGLEIHEEPRISRGSCRLEEGMTATVEPGLYYRGRGACRIEDVVRIGSDGVEMLSDHPVEWEIP